MPKYAYQGSLDTPKTVAVLQPIADIYAAKLLKEFIPTLKLSSYQGKFKSIRDNALFRELIEPPELLRVLSATPTDMLSINNKYARFSTKSRRKLLRAFSYKAFRTSLLAIWFAENLGIKTCMHCNAAFTLSVDDEDSSREPKIIFELDHFFPKSIFPYLSLSFFNLIPCCGSCNRLLGKDPKIHHPLEVTFDALFHVSMTSFDLAACIISPSTKPDIVTVSKDDTYTPIFDKLRLADRYAHFADFAQELIWKNQVYTEAYKHDIENLLKKPDLVNRALWGNYCSPEEYHKRPLSKFCTDICRQLGVLCEPPRFELH